MRHLFRSTSALLFRTRIEEATINNFVKNASYAVRGRLVLRGAQLQEKLKKEPKSVPFEKVVSCNIGNPHALQQKPISFLRDVLSLVMNPSLKDRMKFPKDVIERADRYLANIPGLGAYSESQGLITVRQDIAEFLRKRDGVAGNPANIFLTNGASEGVRLCMQTFLRESAAGHKDGILAPIPQYPLYSALTTLLDGKLVPYYLDEAKGWSCSMESLQEALHYAREDYTAVRGIVVINPGNPTGQVISEENMREIISFCVKENICLMADEVYQENIWAADKKFTSFRKVALSMGYTPECGRLQMVSFHSISKGFLGECGLRGGYFELFGIPDSVRAEIYKLASISLCSNTVGQIATGIMVHPPSESDESGPQYATERDAILSSMKRRATMLSKALNEMEGISCTSIDGAMYAFPTVTIPPKAVEAAMEFGVPADEFYCMQLLEETGIIVVPGSGFGQVDGTYHFRTTVLPPEESIMQVVKQISEFHHNFLAKYQ